MQHENDRTVMGATALNKLIVEERERQALPRKKRPLPVFKDWNYRKGQYLVELHNGCTIYSHDPVFCATQAHRVIKRILKTEKGQHPKVRAVGGVEE